MAITVTSDMTLIHACDADEWSLGGLDTAYQDEGSACLGLKVSNALSALITYTPGSPLDMTDKFLMQPLLVNGKADTKANGGYRIYMETDASNYGYWYVGGSEDKEKWIYFAVDPSTTPTTGTGTVDPSSIAKIGVQFKTVSTSSGNAMNCFWDICHYGSYIQVTSALTDDITWQDIAVEAQSNYWGMAIFNEKLGITAIQGLIKLGSTVSGDVNIDSVGETAIWQSAEFLPDAKSGIEVLGNSGTTTNVSLANGSIKGVTNYPYFDSSDTNVDDVTISANPITHFAAIDLESTTTIISTTIDSCGLVTPLTAVIEDVTISNSTETASYALLMPLVHNLARITYTNNYWGFGVNPATNDDEYTEDGGTFSGNTADVHNIHATNDAIINAGNGSNISTKDESSGGLITIVADQISFALTNLIAGTEVRIYRVSDDVELAGIETSGTSFTYNYTYVADVPVWVAIANKLYYYLNPSFTLTNENASIPINQEIDATYENP